MKRIFILTALFFLFVGSVWAQNDTLNKGVSRSGGVFNGCDCEDGQDFVTRQGNDTLIPHVMRTGKRLEVTVSDACKVLGCGTTDKEAIVEVKIQWTGNTISRITACGLKYHSTNLDCNQDKNWKIDSYPVSICGDSTLQLRLNLSCPDNTYEVQAFVVLLSTKDTVFSNIDFVTKKRNKCGGWIPYDASIEHKDEVDSIDLVYDHQGNEYGVVQIGKQCWTRENMRCSTSPHDYLEQAPVVSDADPSDIIYQVSDETPYFYRFDALNISFQQRGALYNWPAAVDTFGAVKELPPGVRRGICPEGWHVPNIYEWFELVKNVLDGLGGVNQPFDFLSYNSQGEETGSNWLGNNVVRMALGCQWPAYKANGTPYGNNFPGGFMSQPQKRNTSGFSAVPANNLQESGKLGYHEPENNPNLKYIANFWLATPHLTADNMAFLWMINEDRNGVTLSSHNRYRKRGFSVRCLRDQLTIAVTPNKSTICVPYEVTYTAKIAQENLNSFNFKWSVYKDGEFEYAQNSTYTFSYIHYDKAKYKIVCDATRGQEGDDDYKSLSDSVFINTNCDSHFLVVSPEGETKCIGETVTITADSYLAAIIEGIDDLNFEDHADDIKWYLSNNPGDVLGTGASLQYTFSTTGDFTFKFKDTMIGIEDSITISVKDQPYLTVCPDCDSRGFVIKGNYNLSNMNGIEAPARWFTTGSNGQDSTISSAYSSGDLVLINNPNLTYSIAMVSNDGCRDTLRGLVLTTRDRCYAFGGLQDNNEVRYGTDDTKIDSVRDHEGNSYAVVEIGGRCWMKENMRATTTPHCTKQIVNPLGYSGNTATQSYTSRVAHWYNNDLTNTQYGLLYNWCAAADTIKPGAPEVAKSSNSDGAWSCILPANWRGICPEGWHLPTNQEWASMETAVNGDQENPGRLSGGLSWNQSDNPKSPGYYVSNNSDIEYGWGSSGFCAIPAGHFNAVNNNCTMTELGEKARFWTATEGENISQAYQRELTYNSTTIDKGEWSKNRGMSVRCIRNIPTMVLNRVKTDDCGTRFSVSISPGELSDFKFTWKVNNISVEENSDNSWIIYPNDETVDYHVYCKATNKNNSSVFFEASDDFSYTNWPPTLSYVPYFYDGAIWISGNTNVANAYWINATGDTISNAKTTNEYIENLNGEYIIKVANSNDICRIQDTVEAHVVHSVCTLADIQSRKSNEKGPENEPLIDSVRDASGNWYRVVGYTVNNKQQCWLRENMRATVNRAGVDLEDGTIDNAHGTIDNTANTYYYYSYPTSMNIPLRQRGYLYNWKAAQEVCPEGWHLPSNNDWSNLWNSLKSSYMDNDDRLGMMASGFYWISTASTPSPNSPGDMSFEDRNKTLFSAVPAGNLGYPNSTSFAYGLEDANFWTSTPSGSSNVLMVPIKSIRNFMGDLNGNTQKLSLAKAKTRAFSVRCVRDAE